MIKGTNVLKIRLIFVLALLLPASCISRTRVIPQDQRLIAGKSAERAALLKLLEDKSNQVKTLQGSLALDVSGGGITSSEVKEYRQTKGQVVVNRPQHIHFKVQAPLVGTTIADMVSDGSEYRVSIPWKNKFFIGSENVATKDKNPLLNLKPQHIVKAMFVDIMPYLNNASVKSTMEEAVVGLRPHYVFSFINVADNPAQLVEKVWMDRTNEFRITRKQIFGADGKVETDVDFSDYQAQSGIEFPQGIVIQRPLEDYTLKMTFQKTTINQELAAGVFTLERPEGFELVQPVTESSSETRTP
jgi:outer membrane lipoprotein-sorting protein